MDLLHLPAYLYHAVQHLHIDYQRWLRHRLWLARGVALDPLAIVRLGPGSWLEIGEGSSIGPYTLLDLLGDPADPAAGGDSLVIGRRVAINEFNNLRAGGGGIRIGDGCLISQYVSIIASGHGLARGAFMRDQPWDMARRGVTIGADVWLGAGSTVLPGVSIGEGAVVAAGAVVNRDVAPYTIVAGVPAVPVSQR